jgi:hypothetical protein
MPLKLSGYFVLLAVAGLSAALITSEGLAFQFDKLKSVPEIGIFYVLFQVSAALACISAVLERRWWMLAAGIVLLAFDLLAGFRLYTTLTYLSIVTAFLSRAGEIRLFTRIPTYGVGTIAVIVLLLAVHSARLVVFSWLPNSTTSTLESAQMRSDTLQYQYLTAKKAQAAQETKSEGEAKPGQEAHRSLLGQLALRAMEQSQPFVIQATLVAVIQTGLSCRPSNILKSIWIFVPPGLSRIIPNPYPITFYDEYKPVLYPNINYGTGGNIWAEMLCRFGYGGVAIFGAITIAALMLLNRSLFHAPPVLLPAIILSGAVVGFCIQANDLHFTLVQIRQIVMVFVAAYLLSVLMKRFRHLARRS